MNITTISSTSMPSQCASDIQMGQRSSWLFKSNVLTNTIVAAATLVFSYKAFELLKKKRLFSDSANALIKLYMLVVNIHELIYTIIQLWSLYRAIRFSDDPCSIMFTEQECFPWYTASIGSRLIMLFTLCALTLDMVLSCVPHIKANKWRGRILFVVAMVCTYFLCRKMTCDGPNMNIQANCYQRLNRNIDDLKLQINMYLIVIFVCCGLDAVLLFCHLYIKRCRKRFNVSQQFAMRVAQNTAIAISCIVFLQLVFMASYTISIHILIDNGAKMFGATNVSNMVLWCYTYPYACLSLPIGILILTNRIDNKRRDNIMVLTKTNKNEKQTDHFNKLKGVWENHYNTEQMRRNSTVVTKVDA